MLWIFHLIQKINEYFILKPCAIPPIYIVLVSQKGRLQKYWHFADHKRLIDWLIHYSPFSASKAM